MSRFASLVFAAFALAVTASGCATFSPGWNDSALETASTAPQPQGMYKVELRPHRGERERVEIPFSGVPYVQQALKESGAIKRFRRMEVEIVRTAQGTPQKMRSSYDHVHKQVPIEWDYALYPNDLIIVTEDPSTMFDDMVQSALGPIAFLNQKKK